MGRYRDVVIAYLENLMHRDKVPPDEIVASIAPVWGDIRRSMSSKLADEWVSGHCSFRDLLLDASHKALHAWSKPAMRRLMAPEPGREEREIWSLGMRPKILAVAWDRLATYQRERHNQYHTILRLLEERPPAEQLGDLNALLPARPGGRRMDQAAFRKALERARDLFGQYLCDEVEAAYPEGVPPNPQELCRVFVELELMDHAEASKYCRLRMNLDTSTNKFIS